MGSFCRNGPVLLAGAVRAAIRPAHMPMGLPPGTRQEGQDPPEITEWRWPY
jgi:hypothetical protein